MISISFAINNRNEGSIPELTKQKALTPKPTQ
jgi:hypothetical protein